jgi:hypothetical protein
MSRGLQPARTPSLQPIPSRHAMHGPTEVSTLEAASKSVQPTWTNWANIPIGMAGVLAGASLGRKKSSEH